MSAYRAGRLPGDFWKVFGPAGAVHSDHSDRDHAEELAAQLSAAYEAGRTAAFQEMRAALARQMPLPGEP
jgi:hypothetical protein